MKRIQNPKHKEFRLNREFSKPRILDRESKKIYAQKDRESEISEKGDRESRKNKFKGYRIQELENLAE